MTETLTEREWESLRRLIDHAEQDDDLTAQEVRLMREMVSVYVGVKAWGRLAKFLVYALAGIAGVVSAWEVLVQKAREWVGL